MSALKLLASAALLAGLAAAATPALAVDTTFATFSAPNSDANVRYVNSGNGTGRTTDAKVYSTATKTSTVPGSVKVRFSFLEAPIAPYVTNLNALFTLNGFFPKGSPTATFGTTYIEQGFTGVMSFTTLAAITVGGPHLAPHTYAAGSNLLTVNFANAAFLGTLGGHTGSADGSVAAGDTVTMTSDFLDFSSTANRDLSLAFTSILPSLAKNVGANHGLKTFRGVVGGQFSSDPAPIVNGVVPEPASWALMLVGVGLVGAGLRRRARALAAV